MVKISVGSTTYYSESSRENVVLLNKVTYGTER